MREINKIKESIAMNNMTCNTCTRLMINEEVEIQKPGMLLEKIIKEKGNTYIDEIRVRENQVMYGGVLEYQIMYIDKGTGLPQAEMGQLRFEDVLKMQDLKEENDVSIKATVDWISARVINERKMIVKAQLAIYGESTSTDTMEIMTNIGEREDVQLLKNKMEMIEMVKCVTDTIRVKDKCVIPNGKAAISDLLWKDIKVRNVATKPGDSSINISGEMIIFFMYLPEDDKQIHQWHETVIPFAGEIEVDRRNDRRLEDMIFYADVNLKNAEFLPVANEMGENRELEIDVMLKANVKMFLEKEVEILEDMYSLDTNLELIKNKICYNKLLVKNTSRSRNVVKVGVNGTKEGILQICGSSADIRVDNIVVGDDGIVAEGKINAYIIYTTTDDSNPVCTAAKEMDFSHRIDAEGISKEDDYYVNWHVEQTSANMISADEIEVRTIVAMEAFVLKKCEAYLAVDLKEEEIKQRNMPFIRAHVVQKDETLWELAKENRTTMEKIKILNGIKGEQIQEGERVIVAKY